MALSAAILDNIVPISDFSRGKTSTVFAKVGRDEPVIVLKNNKPMAVIVTPEDYQQMSEAEEDLLLYAEAMERLARYERGEDELVSEAEVMAEFGITEEDLDAIGDVEFE